MQNFISENFDLLRIKRMFASDVLIILRILSNKSALLEKWKSIHQVLFFCENFYISEKLIVRNSCQRILDSVGDYLATCL